MKLRKAFGIKGPPASKVVGTHPVVDGEVVPFNVWLSPSIPEWSFVPEERDAPFRIVRKAGDTFLGYEESDDAAAILNEFSRSHLPRYHEVGLVLDNRARIIVGWLWDQTEDAFRWSGCEFGFKILSISRPLDAAIWEAAAKTVVDYPLHNRVVMPND